MEHTDRIVTFVIYNYKIIFVISTRKRLFVLSETEFLAPHFAPDCFKSYKKCIRYDSTLFRSSVTNTGEKILLCCTTN